MRLPPTPCYVSRRAATCSRPAPASAASGHTDWLRRLWQHTDRPLVIDADALNMLADAGPHGPRDWGQRSAATILTPHPGEMGRLLGMSTQEAQRDRIGHAAKYAREQGVTLVLKGARTVIATPTGEAYINTTGHAGMATGGAGDASTASSPVCLPKGSARSKPPRSAYISTDRPLNVQHCCAVTHRPCWPETSSTHCEDGAGVGQAHGFGLLPMTNHF